jgi:hypothetical protein
MNKETLEQAAENYAVQYLIEDEQEIDSVNRKQSFKAGATYMAERMYSEEEQLNLLNKYNEYLFTFIDKDVVGIGVEKEDVIKWFEQFKKK